MKVLEKRPTQQEMDEASFKNVYGFIETIVKEMSGGSKDFRAQRESKVQGGLFVKEIVVDWKTKDGQWKYLNIDQLSNGSFEQIHYKAMS